MRQRRPCQHHGLVAHGEGEHGEGRGRERGGKPGLAELRLLQVGADERAEGLVERDGLLVDAEEAEEAGGRGGHRPDCGCCGSDIQCLGVLRGLLRHREGGERQGAERRGRTDVDEELGDRQAVAHEGAGIGDELGGGSPAELQASDEGGERDEEKCGWRCYSDGSWH